METKEKKLKTDLRKSEFGSPFGNWEVHDFRCFAKNRGLVGCYFLVGIIGDKRLRTGDFVASKMHFYVQNCDRRAYRKIVLGVCQSENKDDVALLKGQVYYALDERNCELVFAVGEWRDPCNVKALFEKMCGQEVPEVQRYRFVCRQNGGYFLDGEEYQVWASMLPDGRVAVCDYDTGLPYLFSADCGTFEKV